jgi:ABC-type transport system substrate-binding protein
MHFIGFNCDSGQCSDYRLRYALQYAIDRDAAASQSLNGRAKGTALPISAYSADYDWELAEKYAYSPDKFAQAMKICTRGC